MPDGNNLTIDFNDSSFDTSQGDVQPVPNIDVDVVFPLDDNPDLTVASGASDNRISTAAPASAIALMPTDGMSSSMEEFLFEFDNDLNDDGTADDQGLKVTTSGGSGGQQVVNHINLQGTLENLHTDGSLDIYVSDKDANGNQVFEKVTLGEGSDTSGNDNITYVGGDTNGGDTGAGDDIVSINVDASATMGGTFLGGAGGYDTIKLVEGVSEDNGARVDFTSGLTGPDSAFVTNFGGVGDGMSFDIDDFESIQLTDNADVIFIASDTGESLTDTYDAVYLNGGGSNSMMKVQTGFTDGGMADVMYVHADSNVYLSFEFANESGLGIQGSFGADGDIDITGHIHGAADEGTDGEVIDVNIDQTGGSGNLTIDYLEATNNHDMITNLGDIGITVDLGGSDGMADVFKGSSTSDNDVLDAREIHDLKFEKSTYDAEYIRVTDVGSTTDGEYVNADLKDVDFIMVRDRAQGPEVTQADVNAYDNETERLEGLKKDAQDDLDDFDDETERLEGLKKDAQDNLDTHSGGLSALQGDVTEAKRLRDAETDPGDTVITSQEIEDYNDLVTRYNDRTDPGNTVITQQEIDDYNDLVTDYNAAVDPRTKVVSGTIGESGVTDANNDNIVDLSDIQAFMEARLDSNGLAFFQTEGITATTLSTNIPADQLATIKTNFLASIPDATDSDSQGFDNFINDVPRLVSAADIKAYDDLVTQYNNATDLSGATPVSTQDIQAYQQLVQDYNNATDLSGATPVSTQDIEAYQQLVQDYNNATDLSGATPVSAQDIQAYQQLVQNVKDAELAVTNHNTTTSQLTELRNTADTNLSTHTSGSTRDDLVTDNNTAQTNLTNHTDVARPVVTDVDFYEDMSHLNGTQLIDGLGSGATDAYGVGYDVVTSAQVDSFADGSNMRVYYEGKHSDFIDTDDIVNGTEGIFDMSDGKSYRGENWENEVDTEYGPGQEPGFYIEVKGKKLAVTFDDEKGEWKVDSSAIQVAEDAAIAKNLGGKTEAEFTEHVMDRYGLQPHPDGVTSSFSDDIYLNATEEAITELLDNGSVSDKAFNFGFYTKMDIKTDEGMVSVNLNLNQTSGGTMDFAIDNSDADVTASMIDEDFDYDPFDLGSKYSQIDLPTTIEGRVDVWNQTLQSNEHLIDSSGNHLDLTIGILNKTTGKIIDANDDEDPAIDDYTDQEALNVATSPSWRSDVDSFISFNVVQGNEYAVIVGDLADDGFYNLDILAITDSQMNSLNSRTNPSNYSTDGTYAVVYSDYNSGDNETRIYLEPYENGSMNEDKFLYFNVSGSLSSVIQDYGTGDTINHYETGSYGGGFDLFAVSDVGGSNEQVVINSLTDSGTGFTLDADDIDVAVESFYNVAEDAGAGVTSSSEAGEFVKIDNSADIALGNGGDDTYVVGADAGIYGGVALEYGNIGVRGGLTASIDAVNINSVDSVEDLTFRRGEYRNEENGNTLFIGDGNGQETVLFDNYNEYLDFRRVEYLTVEDGANNNEIFEIVTNNNLQDWDNEIYVADGGQTNIELGGLDYVIGSTKADEFVIDLSDLIGEGKSGTVNLSGIDASDTIKVNDDGALGNADEAELAATLSAAVTGVASTDGEATITFSYSNDKLTLNVDTAMDELDIINREFDHLASS